MTVLELSSAKARQYFMEPHNYGSTNLPSYFDFSEILAYAAQNATAILRDRDLLKAAQNTENVNYTLISNKDGKYAWRPLQLCHPLLYAVLVHEITTHDNWAELCQCFADFKELPQIECASYPVVSDKRKAQRAEQILSWWSHFEQRSLELALRYNRMIITDIADCYGSIYTHSIAWAIHGKSVAKNNHTEAFLGNVIDHRIQAMRYGQTNGIPQGSVLMDFISEIVLGYADSLVSKQLNEENICDYHILRYRDDYRIFVNDSWTGETILKVLTTTLFELGMRLNSSKTRVSDDIIGDAVKDDKIAWLSLDADFQRLSFEKRLLLIYYHASRFPNCGSIMKPLAELRKAISEGEFAGTHEEVSASVSIVAELAYRHPKVYQVCVAIIAELLNKCDYGERSEIAKSILRKFNHLPNTGFLQVWLQRIMYPSGVHLDYSERLCRKVTDPTQALWENTWLNTIPDIKSSIEDIDIIDRDELSQLKPVMTNDEIDIFISNFEIGYQG